MMERHEKHEFGDKSIILYTDEDVERADKQKRILHSAFIKNHELARRSEGFNTF